MEKAKWINKYPLSTLKGESKQEMISFVAGLLAVQKELFVSMVKDLATDSKLYPAITEGKINESYNIGYDDALLEVLLLFSNIKRETNQKCVICGSPIKGFGNNAEPVAKGLCCNLCDAKVVLPARIKKFNNSK